jgi:hypothetical protein
LSHNLSFGYLNVHSIIDPDIENFAKGQHRGHKNESWNLLRNHVVFPTFGNVRRLSYKYKIGLKPLESYCWSFFDVQLLITLLVSFGHCIVGPSSMYGFWLPFWYLQTFLMFRFIYLLHIYRREDGLSYIIGTWSYCCSPREYHHPSTSNFGTLTIFDLRPPFFLQTTDVVIIISPWRTD